MQPKNGRQAPSEVDRLIAIPEEPVNLKTRLLEDTRFGIKDRLSLLAYFLVGVGLVAATLKYGLQVSSFKLPTSFRASQSVTIHTSVDCPSKCGPGFHLQQVDGVKVLSACRAPAACNRVHMDAHVKDHPKWNMRTNPAHPEKEVKMVFAVKHENIDALEKRLYEISDVDHEDYGKWMSPEEVNEMVAPKPHRVKTLKKWIQSFGFTEDEIMDETANSDFLSVKAKVKQTNVMLNGNLHEFVHADTGDIILRLKENSYDLPDFVAEHVDFITPNVRFHVATRLDGRQYAAGDLVPKVDTPNVMRKLYNVPKKQPKPKPHQSQAFVELINGRYSKSDVRSMWKQYNVRPCVLDRHPKSQGAGENTESIMDATCFTMTGNGVRTIGWTPGDHHFFITTAVELRNTPLKSRPQVVSFSYSSDEQADGPIYIIRANQEFMKVTAQGTTFVASSGDMGVRGIKNQCFKGQFVPSFPASSPFVTGVGGTVGGKFSPVDTDETAWAGSGGGFSVFVRRPKYQNKAVKGYFTKVNVNTQRVQKKGAGYPDISASAGAFPLFIDGFETEGGGTSGSAPFIGGLFSMMNTHRLKANKPVVGFVNPMLYKMHAKKVTADNKPYFYDVKQGKIMGCDEGYAGFEAKKGWDPATGVGTPNFKAMLSFAMGER